MLWKREKRADNAKGPNGRYARGNEELIQLSQVVKTFDTAAGKFPALRGVDLRVDDGEFVAVIGKSGSGKSTLVNMIAGIDRPTSGQVFVGNTAVHKMNEGQMAVWRGRNVGIVFQFFQLLPTLTLAENIMLPMDFCNVHKPGERRKFALELLEQMELADHANKLPAAISGGQQQRVAIARALANDPPILLADEPTGNLDSKSADSVFNLFEGLVQRGKTILMVTHDKDLAKRVTRAVQIVDGEIIEQQLANVFPVLTQAQLVAFTHKVEPENYAPGAAILRQGDVVDRFHVILKGTVEIVIRQQDGTEKIVATMANGDYFGEIELLSGGTSVATARASANSPVEVLRFDRSTFQGMLDQTPELKDSITRLAQERAAENVAARESEERHA
ncbi:MAG: ATP-binding cassette domain-containing protein [Chloroflexi bacterium]|nr:ATP-binding cassette domain-containing protein [Chloroflexota bacterium]